MAVEDTSTEHLQRHSLDSSNVKRLVVYIKRNIKYEHL